MLAYTSKPSAFLEEPADNRDVVRSSREIATIEKSPNILLYRTPHVGLTRLDAFPRRLCGPLCWSTLTPQSYIIQLSVNDVNDIRSALAQFKALGVKPSCVTRKHFRVGPELRDRLRGISKTLYHGSGIAIIRGLDPREFSMEDNVLVYTGILSHIGDKRSANPHGVALEHIRNASSDPRPEGFKDAKLDPAKSSGSMKFHCDRLFADIVSFFVYEKAEKGGDQHFASFWAVYNDLMQNNDPALKELAGSRYWPPQPDRPNEKPLIEPMIDHCSARIISQIIRAPFQDRPEYMTEELRGALDAVNESAKRHSIRVECEPGDIQLLNNFAIMHSRDRFYDSNDRKRHILRMGVRDSENAWDLPGYMEKELQKRFSVAEENQTLPTHDFDPWRITGTNALHHG